MNVKFYFFNILAIYYSCNGIVVVTKFGEDIQYEGGSQGSKRDVWVKFKLDKPCEVYIFVKNFYLIL